MQGRDVTDNQITCNFNVGQSELLPLRTCATLETVAL